MSAGVVFLDKDGTLIDDVPHNTDITKIRFADGACDAITALYEVGLSFVVVTNAGGIGLNLYTHADLLAVRDFVARKFKDTGSTLLDFLYCPHAPTPRLQRASCNCQKPNPTLIKNFIDTHNLDPMQCWMIGDILDDIEAGNLAGCHTILLDVAHETEWDLSRAARVPSYRALSWRNAAKIILEHNRCKERLR